MKLKRQYRISRHSRVGPWIPVMRNGVMTTTRPPVIFASTATRDYRRAVRIVYWLRKRLGDDMIFAGG